jgi:hypothetical protein
MSDALYRVLNCHYCFVLTPFLKIELAGDNILETEGV